MKQFYLKFTKTTLSKSLLGLILFIGMQGMQAATITSNAIVGNWSSTSAWVGGVVPTAADDVVIVSGATISMTASFAMNADTKVTVNSGGILTITNSTLDFTLGTLAVDGTFNNAGKIAVLTSLEGAGIFNNSATASVLKLSGTITIATLTIGSTSNTVEYNGGNQTIKNVTTYRNLITSGSGTKTWALVAGGATAQGLTVNSGAPLIIGNSLTTIASVSMTNSGTDYTVAPTVTFSAPPSGTTATGTAVIGTVAPNIGKITVTITNPGSGYLTPPMVSFTGGTFTTAATGNAVITAPGTFTIGTIGSTISDALTFGASNTGNRNVYKLLINSSGSFIDLSTTNSTISIPTGVGNYFTNNGTVVTNTIAIGSTTATGIVENNGTITCKALGGIFVGSTFVNNGPGVLNYIGTAAPLVNTFTSAPGSTVNYSFTGDQAVRATDYSNLILSGSGTKTIDTAASSPLCKESLSLIDIATATVNNTAVGVDKLFIGGIGKSNGTWGAAPATNSDARLLGAGYLTVATNSLSTLDYKLSNSLLLAPNPAKGFVNINLSNAGKIEIYDIIGRSVYRIQGIAGEQTITLDSLVKGIYLVKADNKTAKLIVQ